MGERLGDVLRLLETEAQFQKLEMFGDTLDSTALLDRHARPVLRLDRQDDVLTVQDVVVFELCSSAAGVEVGSDVRKIAVPGTSIGPCSLFFSSDFTKVPSGICVRRVFSNRILVPRRQVHMITTKQEAISTGT